MRQGASAQRRSAGQVRLWHRGNRRHGPGFAGLWAPVRAAWPAERLCADAPWRIHYCADYMLPPGHLRAAPAAAARVRIPDRRHPFRLRHLLPGTIPNAFARDRCRLLLQWRADRGRLGARAVGLAQIAAGYGPALGDYHACDVIPAGAGNHSVPAGDEGPAVARVRLGVLTTRALA